MNFAIINRSARVRTRNYVTLTYADTLNSDYRASNDMIDDSLFLAKNFKAQEIIITNRISSYIAEAERRELIVDRIVISGNLCKLFSNFTGSEWTCDDEFGVMRFKGIRIRADDDSLDSITINCRENKNPLGVEVLINPHR